MNVLVIPAWYNHKNPSQGVFIHEFCEEISENVNVTVLYLNFYHLKNYRSFLLENPHFNYKYKVLTVNLLNLKSRFLFFLSDSTILNYYYTKTLKHIVKQDKKFDVIHIQSLCNNVTPYIASGLAATLKIPYVLTEHYSSFQQAKGKIFEPFLKEHFVINVARNANARIAVSNYSAELFKKYFQADFTVIYNFINSVFFDQPVSQPKNKTFSFVTVGHLKTLKGSLEVLKAFKQLHLQYPDTRLTFIGEGPLKQDLIDFTKANDLEKSVEFLGWMNKIQLISQLDKSHVLISASDFETFGLTIVEANLRGLPVIATKSGGPEELIDEQNGVLINLSDKIDELTKAMRHMYNNYTSFDIKHIKKNSRARFNRSNVISSYLNIYKNNKIN